MWQLLRWKWKSERPIAIDTHNSSGQLDGYAATREDAMTAFAKSWRGRIWWNCALGLSQRQIEGLAQV
jgi:hypothetical protein